MNVCYAVVCCFSRSCVYSICLYLVIYIYCKILLYYCINTVVTTSHQKPLLIPNLSGFQLFFTIISRQITPHIIPNLSIIVNISIYNYINIHFYQLQFNFNPSHFQEQQFPFIHIIPSLLIQ